MKENKFNERADQAMRDGAVDGGASAVGLDGLAEDRALGKFLAQLPAGPKASSNFTARVLQEIDSIERKQGGGIHTHKLIWARWVTFGAATAMVVLLAVNHGANNRNMALTQGLETVATASAVIESKAEASGQMTSGRTLEIWKDFEAIRKLNQPAGEADWALLAALE